ncbi:unnamed protein product [Pedinophyceae sp. YPF-701]|nr:unnamed protein product [Pedinophyceae sp. YPF-701]
MVAKTAGMSVGEIFNQAQRSRVSHAKWAGALASKRAEDSEAFEETFFTCLQHVLLVFKKEPNVERVVRFVAEFAAAAGEGDEEASAFLGNLLERLVDYSDCSNKAVRYRSCQIIAETLQSLSEDADVSEDTVEAVEQAMVVRLRDKIPQVRAMAVRALHRLLDAGDDDTYADCSLLPRLVDLLSTERTAAVRKEIVANLPLCEATVQPLVARTLDVSEDVRASVYHVLACASNGSMWGLSIADRALLLRRGLADRSRGVQTRAAEMLLAWLSEEGGCGGDVLKLMSALDVETHEADVVAALQILLLTGNVSAAELARGARDARAGLHTPPDAGAPLTPEEALLWRVVCEQLAQDANAHGRAAMNALGQAANVEAATAGDHAAALEAALPDTTEQLVALCGRHAEAGPAHRFAARQLLLVAARCTDLADSLGRAAACQLVSELLRRAPAEGATPEGETGAEVAAWGDAVVELAASAFVGDEEAGTVFLGALAHMSKCWNMEDAACRVRALTVGQLMLRRLSSVRGALDMTVDGMTLPLVVDTLVARCCEEGEHPAARAAAVRCLGSYLMLDRPGAASRGHVACLLAAMAAEDVAVAADATRALCDVALVWGPRCLDAFLPAAAAEGAGADTALQRLLAQVAAAGEALESAAAAGKKAARSRSAKTKELLEAERAGWASRAAAAGVAAEGVAKLLAHNHLLANGRTSAGAPAGMDPAEAAAAAAQLLTAYADPATEEAPDMRQMLATALEAVAAMPEGGGRQTIADALLPAARRALQHVTGTGRSAKTTAPQVLSFGLHLLTVGGENGASVEWGVLLERLGAEAVRCHGSGGSIGKTYVGALCRCLGTLPVPTQREASAEELGNLRAIAEHLVRAVKDAAAVKDVRAFAERVGAAADAEEDGGEVGQGVLDAVLARHLSDRTLPGLPFDASDSSSSSEEEGGAARRARGGRTTRAAAPRGAKKGARASEDEDEGEESETEDGSGMETE